MDKKMEETSITNNNNEPHVLLFPLPIQGNVNSMLKLAELLLLSGLHVTFLNSDHNHRRLLLHTDIQSRLSRYPKLNLQTIPDGLPPDHPRSGKHVLYELLESIREVTQPLFREMLISYRRGSEKLPPLSCMIADGIFGFAIDVAKEIGVRCISFRAISPCYLWTLFCLPQLIQSCEIPFDDGEMDELVTSVPGMEGFLRRRDLPSFCRVKQLPDRTIDFLSIDTQYSIKSDATIFNTFEELDGPILSKIRCEFSNVYTIGPLHAHLKLKLQSDDLSSNSLWKVDRSCLTWLDSQPVKSVIYVSFGSITIIAKDQFMELWYGLMNSNKPFLWVIRPGSIAGLNEIPLEVSEGSKGRGYMVGWAPQEEILAHPAVGGFFTHSGWNSTMESIVAGVPMICWPYFADQQVNSRFVSEVWSLGLDMKDVCNRVVVEKMVNELMELRKDEFTESADMMAEMARKCLSDGGSSYREFNRLVKDIQSINM